jgi:hypothetical protein
MGYHLADRGLEFLIVDGNPQVGHVWRSRWDSLRLFTSTTYNNLPGMEFAGTPGDYPGKDATADYLATYASEFQLPMRLNTQRASSWARSVVWRCAARASGRAAHERDELFLAGLDESSDRGAGAGEVAVERLAAAGGGVLGARRLKATVDLGAHELGVLQQAPDLAPHERLELVGADPAAGCTRARRRAASCLGRCSGSR